MDFPTTPNAPYRRTVDLPPVTMDSPRIPSTPYGGTIALPSETVDFDSDVALQTPGTPIMKNIALPQTQDNDNPSSTDPQPASTHVEYKISRQYPSGKYGITAEAIDGLGGRVYLKIVKKIEEKAFGALQQELEVYKTIAESEQPQCNFLMNCSRCLEDPDRMYLVMVSERIFAEATPSCDRFTFHPLGGYRPNYALNHRSSCWCLPRPEEEMDCPNCSWD